eukprot:13528881-Heterocapsa_arctica.AAC.1
MPFSTGDMATLKGLFQENSMKDEFKQFAEQQMVASREMHEHLTRLTNDMIQVKSDIEKLWVDYDMKIKEL